MEPILNIIQNNYRLVKKAILLTSGREELRTSNNENIIL